MNIQEGKGGRPSHLDATGIPATHVPNSVYLNTVRWMEWGEGRRFNSAPLGNGRQFTWGHINWIAVSWRRRSFFIMPLHPCLRHFRLFTQEKLIIVDLSQDVLFLCRP